MPDLPSIGDYFDIDYSGEVAHHHVGEVVHICINGDAYHATITSITNRAGQLTYDVDSELGPTWVFSEQIVRLS